MAINLLGFLQVDLDQSLPERSSSDPPPFYKVFTEKMTALAWKEATYQVHIAHLELIREHRRVEHLLLGVAFSVVAAVAFAASFASSEATPRSR